MLKKDNFYIPESAMVIVAHPDDPEFSCSGTMARWAKEGTRICYVLCTSGDVGIAEAGMTREKATLIREAEQQEAATLYNQRSRNPFVYTDAGGGLRSNGVFQVRSST